MKIKLLILLLTLPLLTFAQNITGSWKTIDDETKETKSIVEIFKKDGKIYGKINKLLTGNPDRKCTECKDDLYDKPIQGMVFLKDLTKDGDEWNDGTILDPGNGKIYSCYIALETNDKLKVRGFLGFSLLGRTQYWYRVK